MLTQTPIRVDAIRSSVSSVRAPSVAMRGLDGTSKHQWAKLSMHLMGATRSYLRNTEVFGENEPADYLYKIVGGCVRTYKILNDGRRQIGGFYLPGDIFGLEFEDEHTVSAETLTDTQVMVIKRGTLNVLARHDPVIAQELFTLTGRELQRMQHRLLLLIKSARERVASFLLEMAERVPAGDSIELPMIRQDIADYLGLTIETVSRTLSSLERCAVIEVPNTRQIVLRNRPALQRMIS